MASNMPSGELCIGQSSVCLLRAAVLDTDCTPLGGADSAIVTTAVVDMTATPDVQEGQVIEQPNGCGDTVFRIAKPDKVLGYTIEGNLAVFDQEALKVLFGGTLMTGKTGGDFAGEVIGWAQSVYTDPAPPAVYLEVFTQSAAGGTGECSPAASPFPQMFGHVFGKTRLRLGTLSFTNGVILVPFTGRSEANPNLFDGPWNDNPATGYLPNSPYFHLGYSAAEYQAIFDEARCGFADALPVGS